MKPGRPQTKQDFLERIGTLVRAGRDREALAYTEQFSREFLPQLTTEELNRLGGTMEGAQMIVDLEDWQASQPGVDGAAPTESVHVALTEESSHGA